MKKYTAYKTLQLILFLLLTGIGLFRIFSDADVYHRVATDAPFRLIACIAWVAIGISFLFIFLDFTFFFGYRKEYREMDLAVHADPVSGIANRFSCDMVIEKYADKALPDTVGVIMIDLTNIQKINTLYGHVMGNMTIRDFSNILRLSSQDLCFVGRNGGNKFLAIFEDCTEERMKTFLDRIEQRVALHNHDSETAPIEYRAGSAFREGAAVRDITSLIGLANRRINESGAEAVPTPEKI